MNLDRFRKACDRAWFTIRRNPFLSAMLSYFDRLRQTETEESAMPTTSNDSNTYFKLFQSKKNRQWYFSIHGGNHRVIAQSEGYKRKESAEKTIATLKRELAAAKVKE